jgi:hypothetical protein
VSSCIKIEFSFHRFYKDNKGGNTNEISNKSNKPSIILLIDSTGNIIEHISSNNRRFDNTYQNFYKNEKLIKTIVFTWQKKKKYIADYETDYTYNSKGFLIQKRTINCSTKRLVNEINYQYDSIGNKIKTTIIDGYFVGTTTLKWSYDNLSKMNSYQQYNNNDLSWEWVYTYTDTSRTGIFNTHYKDDKNYSSIEIVKYNNGRPISIEEITTHIPQKTLIHYDKQGLVSKIEIYESYDHGLNYKHKRFASFHIKNCKEMSAETIKRINAAILKICFEE